MLSCSSENVYLSAGINNTPGCLTSYDELLCYGSCNAVIVCKNEENLLGKSVPVAVDSLVGHTGRVNCVRLITSQCLISGSSDKSIIVWKKNVPINGEVNSGFYSYKILNDHTASVTGVDGIFSSVQHSSLRICSVSADSSIRIWKVEFDLCVVQQEGKEVRKCLSQNINLGYRIATAVKICELTTTLIFASMDDSSVHIYGQNDESSFVHKLTLMGHEDWIVSMDVIIDPSDGNSILLACASQDTFIRMWRISRIIASGPISCTKISESNEKFCFEVALNCFNVSLETVLAGHDDKVYGLHWSSSQLMGERNQLCLLSCSMDKTLIVWVPPCSTAGTTWFDVVRVGDVGGNSLGFAGCQWSASTKTLVGYGFHGGFYAWQLTTDGQAESTIAIGGGHFKAVTDLAWDIEGRYLLSVSFDQTSRIHAVWRTGENDVQHIWREIARPQIHGYDLKCVSSLPCLRFASGADEKIIRVFEASANFASSYASVCNRVLCSSKNEQRKSAQGASVPSLGLSNKAHTTSANNPFDLGPGPPSETYLAQNSLWPETRKLYGHGYEIFCLASTPDIIASACRSTKTEHAKIFLWYLPFRNEHHEWKLVDQLSNGHSLTVTQMEFSPNEEFLLSVGRDRIFCLFQRKLLAGSDFPGFKFELISTLADYPKKLVPHQRIIWCCGWYHDSRTFATGSRDKKIVIWTKTENLKNIQSRLGDYDMLGKPLVLSDSVRSLCFVPLTAALKSLVTNYVIAVGLENGNVVFCQWSEGRHDGWTLLLNVIQAHHMEILRIRFSPSVKEDMLLATCGADNAVRIFKLVFNVL